MKPKIFLLILITTLIFGSIAYGECPEGENWIESYIEADYQTYTLEAPCKVYIGTPFNITAKVVSTCADGWIAHNWAIIDNGEVIASGGSITTTDGQWQKVIERTYLGDPVDHLIEFQFIDHRACYTFHSVTSNLIGNVTVDPYPSGPTLSCLGFEPPLDKSPIKFKKNRVLPLKAQLADNGSYITDIDITAPPVVQILYDSGVGGDPIDVSDDVLSAGQGTDGNQFVFTEEGKWQFNLQTKNYTASGTYTVSMETGDSSEYTITPTCSVDFVVE